MSVQQENRCQEAGYLAGTVATDRQREVEAALSSRPRPGATAKPRGGKCEMDAANAEASDGDGTGRNR